MASRQIIVDLVEGDDAPELAVRFTGLDLSQYSTIKMLVQKQDDSRFNRDVVPDGSDAELGWVTWEAGDLTKGRHRAEFEFIRTLDSKRFTLPRKSPVILNVREDLGP